MDQEAIKNVDDNPRQRSKTPSIADMSLDVFRKLKFTTPDTPLAKFSGYPLGKGSVENTIQTGDITYLHVPMAHLRRTIARDPITEKRKEIVLTIAEEVFRDENRLPATPLPRHAENLASDIINDIEWCLTGIPVEVESSNGQQKIGYHADIIAHQKFTQLIIGYIDRAERVLRKGRDVIIPQAPQWGLDGDPLTVWSANDFELLAVLFREDIENLLAYLFSHGALIPERKKENSIPEVTTANPTRPYKNIVEEDDPFINSSERSQGQGEGLERACKRISEQQFRPRPELYVPGVYGAHPTRMTRAGILSEMFETPTRQEPAPEPDHRFNSRKQSNWPPASVPSRRRNPPDDNPPSDSSDDEENNHGRNPPRRFNQSWNPPRRIPEFNSPRGFSDQAHFEATLKHDIIPKWDGNPDTLVKWINKINNLSERSEQIYVQLGQLVPTRLERDADLWYWSLSSQERRAACKDWGTLRDLICSFYMNRAWLDKQKGRANRAHYRESGHTNESPMNYYIRKTELLNLVYTMSDSELMMEVMNNAPKFWTTILDPHRCRNLSEFTAAIKYHEEALQEEPLIQGSSMSIISDS